MSPENLARVTTERAFEESQEHLDESGRLSFAGFREWYSRPSGMGAAVAAHAEQADDAITLAEARRLTNLASYDVAAVYDAFAEHADEEGLISKPAFFAAFRRLIRDAGNYSELDQARTTAK